MAFITPSAWNGTLLRDSLTQSDTSKIDFDSATPVWRCALYTSTVTGIDKNSSTTNYGVYSATNECTHAGYTAGGGTEGNLGTPTLTASAGVLLWGSATGTQIWGGGTAITWTTSTGPEGLIVYASASVATQRAAVYINFGTGAGIAVTASTLTVTWGADKVGKITY